MRIGVNIPDELLKRAKGVRPQVKVSKVCREALETLAALDAMNKWRNEHSRFERAIEDPPVDPDWEGMALEDARNWIRAVKPEQWERFIENWNSYGDESQSVTRIVEHGRIIQQVRSYFDMIDEHREWFNAQDRALVNSAANPWARANYEYCRAWLGYVSEIRMKVDQLHKEEYDRVVAERERNLLSSPEPEAPPQLMRDRG